MFQYCPACGLKNIHFERNKFSCPDCGFVYYHNTAAATSCIICSGEKILLLKRNKDPGKGKLDLPGGFVDPNEGIIEGLRRELKEELGWQPEVKQGTSPFEVFKLFASFPNTYPYKNIIYNTCDLFFVVSASGLTEKDFTPEKEEIADLFFINPNEIKNEDLAFDSIRRAIDFFKKHST